MRALSGLFLFALLTVLGVLAYENNRETTLHAWTYQRDVPLPVLIGAAYALGMVTGWWMLGMVRRSWQRVTEPDRARA